MKINRKSNNVNHLPVCTIVGTVILRVLGVDSVLEKSLKMLEFGIKTSRPLKVLENR